MAVPPAGPVHPHPILRELRHTRDPGVSPQPGSWRTGTLGHWDTGWYIPTGLPRQTVIERTPTAPLMTETAPTTPGAAGTPGRPVGPVSHARKHPGSRARIKEYHGAEDDGAPKMPANKGQQECFGYILTCRRHTMAMPPAMGLEEVPSVPSDHPGGDLEPWAHLWELLLTVRRRPK